MSAPGTHNLNPEQHLRLWPGVLAVVLQWGIMFGVPAIAPDYTAEAIVGGFIGGSLAILVWWLFFTRIPHVERWGALLLIAAAAFVTRPFLHPSITGGMMGMMFGFTLVPTMGLALVVWAAAVRRLARGPRRAALVAAILLACGFWTLMRTDGITGEGHMQLAWRWAKTPEQKLLAQPMADPILSPPATPEPTPPAPEPKSRPAALRTSRPATIPTPSPAHTTAAWPGFRGPHRDDIVTGLRINTDWSASPPVELWRRAIGPGWSSFAVSDGLIYTQEQRGDSEAVSCYKESTGEPVWTHRDTARFWESNAGAGPRATPAVDDGRVYTLGATGILNALDAASGRVVWTRNAAADTGTKTPDWGFAGSPLVLDGMLIVATAGRLAAYDLATGAPRWTGPPNGGGYSSPQLLTIAGVPQIALIGGRGLTSFAPADGKVLWSHAWPGAAMLQPTITPEGAVLMTTGDTSGGAGTRRLAVTRAADGAWTAAEVWTSTGLKPYFNDIVVHNGHAFGFDGGILASIDLQDGKRDWKGGRYGHGQLLLLGDQDLLLVLSEEGEIALVSATPAQFKELARVPALEGKTWNHPVLAGGILLIRNGQEMVAFRLPQNGG